MMEHRRDPADRNELWAAAKLAVRRYSRDPSETAAAAVRSNFRKLRDMPVVELRSFRALRPRRQSGRGPDALS